MPKTRAPSGDVRMLGEVVARPPGEIRPYPANARRISDKAVRQCVLSLRRFGWQQPIVTDPDGVIIAGHVRHRAATELKLPQVPVVVAEHLSPAEVRAYRIADNRTHDYTTWDYGLLAAELDGLGGEFGDVLDLADWEAVIGTFEASQGDGDVLGLGETGAGHVGGGYPVTVVFATQDEADKAGPALLEIPGVVNVRHSR